MTGKHLPRSSRVALRSLFILSLCGWLLCSCATVAPRPTAPVQRWAVLVPGLFDYPSRFNHLKPLLEERGYRVLPISLNPNDGSVSIRRLAEQLRVSINQTIPPQDDIALVGFSMGGLVGRSYVQEFEGWRRVTKLLTIATPNQGTTSARLLGATAGPEMTPGSPFLRSLNVERLRELRRVRHGALYSVLDGVIWPSNSSRLPSGWNQTVPAIIHGKLLADRRVLAHTLAFLDQ